MLKEGYIICEDDIKQSILRSNNKGFKDYTFLNSKALLNALTFEVEKEGVLAYSLYKNIKPEIVKEYFEYLQYVSLFDKVSDNPKIKNLIDIYNYLKDNNFLIYNPLLKNNLYKRNISIVGYDKTDKDILFIESLLDSSNIKYQVIDALEYENVKKHKVYEFKTLLDESRYVFNQIKELLDSGVSINNIKICNYTDDYYHAFYRLSSYYNIPINFEKEKNILSSAIAKKLLLELSNDENKTIVDVMNKLNKLDPFYKKIMNIVNSYHLYHYKPSECIELLKMELKKISYEAIRYDNGIELTNLYSPSFTKNDHVFVIGFNQSVLPRIFVDNGYLDDSIISKMGLNTSQDNTALDKKIILHNLNLDTTYYLSYKLRSPFAVYLRSEFINEFGYEVIVNDMSLGNVCEEEDNIIFATSLDNYSKYGEKDKYFQNIYDIGYASYDNAYTGIKKETIDKIVPEIVKLSYSTMDTYAGCSFEYLLSKILYLDEFEHTINTDCGTYAHKILELHYKEHGKSYLEYKQAALDELLDKKQEEANRGNTTAVEITSKEAFFYDVMDEFIKHTIEFNDAHEKKAHFDDILTEYEEEILFDNGKLIFKGFIDKIMRRKVNGKDYIAIVDYKSGVKTPELKNVEYGFNMQLPSYAYMVKHDKEKFGDAEILGLYLQKIGPSNKDEYRLQGFTNISNDNYLQLDELEPGDKSDYIKGLALKKDGSLNQRGSSLIDNKTIDNLIKIVENNLLKFYQSIRDGEFSINPKFEKNSSIPCKFCKFKNICYRSKERVDIDTKEDDSNGMD